MYVIKVNAETSEGGDVPAILAEWGESGSVQLVINEESDMSTLRCSGCGEETDIANDEPCDGSGNFIDCVEHVLDADGDCEHCNGSGQIEVHEWEPVPLAWCNSASIYWDPDQNSMTVAISVGDPRGAFVMDISQDSETGQLWLSLPHEHMSMPHVPLREHTPGMFELGN